MPALSSPLFTGCAAALVTPFLPGGALDEEALRRLIHTQIDAGMDALVLLGTTGEPSTLTMEERERVIRIGIETAHGKLPVIVGTGANDTKKAVAYAGQAEALGADGQLCVTPYYNKATQSGLIRHFSAIMDSCSLPTILYNVPGRTGMSISPTTAAELAVHPHLAGIKEASGDPMITAEIIERTGGTLPVYSGNDELILPLMALGAKGAISVCANVVPMQTRAITKACLSGCFGEARKAQQALYTLIRALFAQVNPIPVKAALFMMGKAYDELRLPLTPLEEPHREKLRAVLSAWNLLHADGEPSGRLNI